MVASRSFWQYRSLVLGPQADDELNALGVDEGGGWELVSVDQGVAYFKRLRSEADARRAR